MNMSNILQIKLAVVSQVLDIFIIAMNNKHYNRLSNKIIPTQIKIFNM
jgi:uncharacterized Rmd1/YagE family protein